MNEELYKQHIMDHYRRPRNKEELEDPDVIQPAKNAACGDSYILYLKIRDGSITKATFSGVGCAVSQASASILTERVTGMTVPHALRLTEGDVYAMLGVPISAGREKCALLLFRAFQEALTTYTHA